MYFYDAFSFTWRKGLRKRFNLPVCTHCYYMTLLLAEYRKGLDEKILNTVSLAKDVLNNIENACSTFLVKDVLVSLCAKILQL